MADGRGRDEDGPSNPVVRHGRASDAGPVSPVQGARTGPSRRGPEDPQEPRTRWGGRGRRRLTGSRADDAPGATRRTGSTAASSGPPARRATDRGYRPAGQAPRTAPARGDGDTVEVPVGQDGRAGADDAPDVDPELVPTYDDSVVPDSHEPLRGPDRGPLRAVHRKLGRSLVPGEHILVAQTRHPVVLAWPVLGSLLALLGVAAVSPYLGSADLLRTALMLAWAALAARALWSWLQWANDLFVVTDRRLIRLHGLFTVQRDMMPLTKVTDMAFERPFWGRPFNYGRFVLESAGKDQALREITYVRDPENVDAIIGRQVFARSPYQPGAGR